MILYKSVTFVHLMSACQVYHLPLELFTLMLIKIVPPQKNCNIGCQISHQRFLSNVSAFWVIFTQHFSIQSILVCLRIIFKQSCVYIKSNIETAHQFLMGRFSLILSKKLFCKFLSWINTIVQTKQFKNCFNIALSGQLMMFCVLLTAC